MFFRPVLQPTLSLRSWACYSRPPTLPSKHAYSTVSHSFEQVAIPCRTNGYITLDIHRTPNQSTSSASSIPRILIHLPRGPLLQDPSWYSTDHTLASHLALAADATVVQINYRLDRNHQFPTPVHDVLVGYDWVVKHLALGNLSAPGSQVRHSMVGPHSLKLGVTGELVGGGLAIMLGLTEAKLGESRVVAVGVGNPIVDWVFPEDDAKPLPSKSSRITRLGTTSSPRKRVAVDKSAVQAKKDAEAKRGQPKQKNPSSWTRHAVTPPLDKTTMANARTFCFPLTKPETYFDPFASPILFLRTPGVDIPVWREHTIEDDFQALSGLQAEEALAATTTPGPTQIQEMSTWIEKVKGEDEKRRRTTPRRYPPVSMALRIPFFRISAGRVTVLADQASEMVRLLRKAEARTDVDKVGGVDDGLVESVLGWNEDGTDNDGYNRDRATEAEYSEDDMVCRLNAVRLMIERKIMLHMGDGDGLWCGKGGDSDVVSAGKWIGDVLSKQQ